MPSLQYLINQGYKLSDLKSAGFTATELKALYTATELLAAGFTVADFKPITLFRIWYRDTYGDSWNDGSISFKETNTDLNIITLNGPPYNTQAWNFIDAIFNVNTNYTITKVDGIFPTEIIFAVTTTNTSAYLGTETAISTTTDNYCILTERSDALTPFSIPSKYYFSATELKAANFSVTQLKAANFSAAQLKTIGFTATELKPFFNATELKGAGFLLVELKGAQFSATELKGAGFNAIDLKTNGFTATELKDALFTAAELKPLFLLSELKTSGFTATELKAALYTAAELKAGGFLLAELFNSGFTSTILFENNIDVFTMPVTNQSQLLDVISNTNVRNIFIQSDIILNNPAKLTAIGNKIIKNDSSFNVTITAE